MALDLINTRFLMNKELHDQRTIGPVSRCAGSDHRGLCTHRAEGLSYRRAIAKQAENWPRCQSVLKTVRHLLTRSGQMSDTTPSNDVRHVGMRENIKTRILSFTLSLGDCPRVTRATVREGFEPSDPIKFMSPNQGDHHHHCVMNLT
jgi:hypothetical protein